MPAQSEGGRYCWGLCQVWETGQQLALSQPQMLAWAAVPGAASPRDPLAGQAEQAGGCWALGTVQGALSSPAYQPHLTKTIKRCVLLLSPFVGQGN